MGKNIYQFTPEQLQILYDWSETQSNGIVTQSELSAAISKFRNDLLNPATQTAVEIISGAITVARDNRFTYLTVDTEGQSANDDLTQINGTKFQDWDQVFMRSTGRNVNVLDDPGGNIRLKAEKVELHESDEILVLFYFQGNFIEGFAHPGGFIADDLGRVQSRRSVVTVGESQDADINRFSYVSILGRITGEVRATGTIDVGTPGATGTIEVRVNEFPSGDISLGVYSYSGSPTPDAVGAGIEALINAGTSNHGYDAVYIGFGSITITAPVGSGADANAFTFTLVATGDAAPSVVSNFASGVDGVAQSETINTFNDVIVGQWFFVENGMNGAQVLTFVSGGNIQPGDEVALQAGEVMLCFVDNAGEVHTFGHPSIPKYIKLDFTYDQFTANAVSEQLSAYSLPPGYEITAHYVKHTQAFAGPGLGSCTVSIGTSSNPVRFAGVYDLLSAVNDTTFTKSFYNMAVDWAAATPVVVELVADITIGNGSTTNFTAGAFSVWYKIEKING